MPGVKPGQEAAFVDTHRTMDRQLPGLRQFSLLKTGERSFCVIGEWDDMSALVNARAAMIGNLDRLRPLLEDLGNGLKVRRVLLARTQGALHTIGVSIVASCFRDMGWDVDGGADLELDDSLYLRLSNSSYSLLGISVGRVDEVDQCAAAIRRVQSSRSTSTMKIAVGGPAVMKNPRAFGSIGADMVARSAIEVMHLADKMA